MAHQKNPNPTTRAAVALLATALLVTVGWWPQPAGAGPKDKVDVIDLGTGEAVTGAFSQLDRSEDGIASKVRTRADAGNAYSLWYVIFNAPERCDGPCGADDIFNDPGDPTAGFNVEQIRAARISVVGGVGGGIGNAAGRLKIDSAIGVHTTFEEHGTVVIGLPEDEPLAPVAGTVTGLENGHRAEVHLVIQDHGAAHEDADLLHRQLNHFNAACNPDCTDVQASVHLP